MEFFRKHKLTLLGAVIAAAITLVVALSQGLYSLDKLIADPLYQQPSTPDHTIRILAIDEKTIAAYGDVGQWSREIPARLVELLDEDPETAPAVITFDVLYISQRDAEADQRFADACADGGNVVAACNVVYRTALSRSAQGIVVDTDHIDMVETPYAALNDAVSVGFANTYLDKDQFVRYARWKTEYNGETLYSLPAATYVKYAEATGGTVNPPRTDGRDLFSFAYTGKSGSYEVLSLCDVLEGNIPREVFDDCIVFVGAYAPGMQDAYNAAIQHGTQMYGVEIHANILEALMEGRTGIACDGTVYAVVAALIALAWYLVSKKLKVVHAALVGAGIIVADVLISKLLYSRGVEVRLIEIVAAVLAIFVFRMAKGYIGETLKKRKILNAFKKYVAPQVVEEVANKGDFTIQLGGEKRHIAVLFVDIRGFTPMSEGLQPEQVVEILNEYLNLTTNAIFKNGGTLDKFIGDATMAVFNAPFALDDYIYRAVCTARDIAAGSEELERKLMERFGKSVSFGIGVNCGDAVVGNIGCDFRMDYTAIGDTVNTAARLESNAKRGQILISEAVYEAVKDRVSVTEVGVIPLKGKSNDVFVYQVDEVK